MITIHCSISDQSYLSCDLLITFRVAKAKCILITTVCVCVSAMSLAAFPHCCTDPDVTWRNGRVLSSCALLNGGFAVGARVSLL